MLDIMKPTIPKSNNNYRLVEPNELPLISLSDQEKLKINAFKKTMNASPTVGGCFAFIMGILFLILNVYTYRTGQHDSESILALCLGALLFWTVGILSFLGRIPKKSCCIHAQYGIVNGKWPGMAHNSSGSSRQKYFLDIIFPDTGTRYKQAICCQKDYKRVVKGQRVLAFALDERKRNRLYGILVD